MNIQVFSFNQINESNKWNKLDNITVFLNGKEKKIVLEGQSDIN